ncbi:hypothetical protein ZWY2020_042754 [Hordeum vulgare]|nr:hypothetical protein ZWY2020_042754 [Hordeum vulgare]
MRGRGGGFAFGWICPAGGVGLAADGRLTRWCLAAGRPRVTTVVRIRVLAPLEALFGGGVRLIQRSSPADDGWLPLLAWFWPEAVVGHQGRRGGGCWRDGQTDCSSLA